MLQIVILRAERRSAAVGIRVGAIGQHPPNLDAVMEQQIKRNHRYMFLPFNFLLYLLFFRLLSVLSQPLDIHGF